MAKVNKEDVFEELEKLIDSLSKEKRDFQAEKLREIKENLKHLLYQDDKHYYDIVSESLQEDWDNDKDDGYNDV